MRLDSAANAYKKLVTSTEDGIRADANGLMAISRFKSAGTWKNC